jgi:hypothetical protein
MAGENGRPHQAFLVEALGNIRRTGVDRRRNCSDCAIENSSSKAIVDIDESLPSSDSTTLEEQ